MPHRLTICVLAALTSLAAAAPAAAWPRLSGQNLLVEADWQPPQLLPRRFRNHCAFDSSHGHYYCSDHCGLDYQFYFCSSASFGCCRMGYGYCDWRGALRCAP
jgi:hypothetical protein